MTNYINMPNGCKLQIGSRIRLPREMIWKISEELIEKFNLTLDHDAASPDSEVIEWPTHNAQ